MPLDLRRSPISLTPFHALSGLMSILPALACEARTRVGALEAGSRELGQLGEGLSLEDTKGAECEDGLVAQKLVEGARLVGQVEGAAEVGLLELGDPEHLVRLDWLRELPRTTGARVRSVPGAQCGA